MEQLIPRFPHIIRTQQGTNFLPQPCSNKVCESSSMFLLLSDSGSTEKLSEEMKCYTFVAYFNWEAVSMMKRWLNLYPVCLQEGIMSTHFTFTGIWWKSQNLYTYRELMLQLKRRIDYWNQNMFNKNTVPHKNNILNVQATIKSQWSHEESGNYKVNEKRQSTDNNTQMMQSLELSGQEF